MKAVNGYEIIELFEQFSPKKYAVEGDKIGLQIGSLNQEIKRVIVALDVTELVVDEAIEQDAQLIIAHHPLIFNPLKNILTTTGHGKIIEKLIKHDIAVYVAHTNLDVTPGGVNDMLAETLQLSNTEVLVPTYEDELKKLAVYIPVENADELREALGNSGAGFIGDYSHCSFSINGTGRFLPGEDTNPHIGVQGKLEAVEEVRIETIYPASIEKDVLKAMYKAHPYEEVAYDIYPLENDGLKYGLGRVGYLSTEMTLQQFAEHAKQCLQVDGVRVVGNLDDKVRKVAVLGGDGNKYYSQAKFAGADVYVTGDVYYHTAQDAQMLGINIVDPGHHIEQIMKQGVTDKLQSLCANKKFAVEIMPSQIKTEPFQFL